MRNLWAPSQGGKPPVLHQLPGEGGQGKNLRKGQEPVKFATYQGHVVGFYRQVDGKLIPRLLRRNSDGLPKSKTLDLNHYIEGFTREQVKNLKAAILQLAHS